MHIGNIGQLKPKKFLSLGRHDLRHVGDLSKPFFVAIGCSATKGDELNYDDCWVKQLANKLNLEHINLGFTGSSLEYQLDVYQKSKSILNNALFTVWMHPFAYRTHKFKLRNILGDRLCRIKFGNKLDDIDTWHKIQKYVKTVYNDKVIITNCWGYNQKIKLLIQNKICKKNKNYFLNNGEIIDHGHDKLHAGPKCHALLANDLHNHIVKHFDHWLSNK